MNFGKFDLKTVEKSIINTIFKQQVISEPQKSYYIFQGPERWLLINWLLVKKVYEHFLRDPQKKNELGLAWVTYKKKFAPCVANDDSTLVPTA